MSLFIFASLLLSVVQSRPADSGPVKWTIADASALAEGITAEQMAEAYPPRDPANIQNWYGTSLFGFDGCDKKNKAWRGQIKEAYSDANKLVNYEAVRTHIDFNSAAAFEFLGPSGYNKNEQAQIQNVFDNLASMHEAHGLWTPNWIRIRCDDPANVCPKDNDDDDGKDPGCPSTMDSDDVPAAETLAYARDPFFRGNDRFSMINICRGFFKQRNLDNAMAYGAGSYNPSIKADLRRYSGRANIILHELLHLDLAANSKNGNPNPHVSDLKIRSKYYDRKDQNRLKTTPWYKIYGPGSAKIMARMTPLRHDVTVGYFVQRSDDNLTMFALARYVQEKLGFYPYIPTVFLYQLDGLPRVPRLSDGDEDALNKGSIIGFSTPDDTGVLLGSAEQCPTYVAAGDDAEEYEFGAPIPKSAYSDEYWEQHDKWVKELQDSFNLKESWYQDTCFDNDVDFNFTKIAPPLMDSRAILDQAVERACSTLPDYASDEKDVEWSSCLQKDADRFGGEAAVIFSLKRVDDGEKPASIDCERSLKYMYHTRGCVRGGFQSWPSKEDWRFTYRMLVRTGKCPGGIDVFHRSSGSRPF